MAAMERGRRVLSGNHDTWTRGEIRHVLIVNNLQQHTPLRPRSLASAISSDFAIRRHVACDHRGCMSTATGALSYDRYLARRYKLRSDACLRLRVTKALAIQRCIPKYLQGQIPPTSSVHTPPNV